MGNAKLNESMKAVFAGVTAFLGSLQVALLPVTLPDGTALPAVVTGAEWVTIASATVAALALVYGVSNEKSKLF